MKSTTVILAAGDFPRKGTAARRILERAARVVCCDSAADAYRRRIGRSPAVVVGDCDSVKGKFDNVVRIAEQDTNDLEKAIRHCAEQGWESPVILGATGKREDHAIGNLFRAMEHSLEVVTDRGRFIPVAGSVRLTVRRGAAVSVFANPGTRMTSKGLQWPLDGVEFANFHRATLNRANASVVEIVADRPAYVYLAGQDECPPPENRRMDLMRATA